MVLSKANRDLKDRLLDQEKEIERLSNTTIKLKDELASIKEAQDGVIHQKDAIGGEIALLTQEKGREENKNKIKELQRELEKRANTILSLQEKLNSQHKEMEQVTTKVNTYIKELALLREDYVKGKLENTQLRRELEVRNKRLQGFKEELSLMMKMNSQLRERIEYLSGAFRQEELPSQLKEKAVEVELEAVDPKEQ